MSRDIPIIEVSKTAKIEIWDDLTFCPGNVTMGIKIPIAVNGKKSMLKLLVIDPEQVLLGDVELDTISRSEYDRQRGQR